MILAALAVAAALEASPAVQAPLAPPAHVVGRAVARSAPFALPPIAERTPNLYRVPAGCADAAVKVVDRFGRPVAYKLGDLPKGALIYAVDRRENGCPVLMVAYGTPALDNPNPTPAPQLYATPAKREDAPSNRR
jgi:hypothetical protein